MTWELKVSEGMYCEAYRKWRDLMAGNKKGCLVINSKLK